MELINVKCKCCGHEYKSHPTAGACHYSITPGYGCMVCEGVEPYQEWNATTEYCVGDRFTKGLGLFEITQTGPSAKQEMSEIVFLDNGNVMIGDIEYYEIPPKTFESELHELRVKYGKCNCEEGE